MSQASTSPGPPGLRRFSSREHARHDQSGQGGRLDLFLKDRLLGARSYDRIAGYFRSSIFEVAGEELASIGRVRIVCNSDLAVEDIRASQEARASAMLQRMWADGTGEGSVELDTLLGRDRYAILKEMLRARDGDGNPRLQIRVVDKNSAPLVHGKAGIITRADGTRTCFMGSVNETRHGWRTHYELLWEDESEPGVTWTQAEFDFLWARAVDLPDAVIHEIERRANRVEIRLEDCPVWSLQGETDLPRAALAESPLARAGEGLQPWQKSFVAEFLRQREVYGKARMLLADEVGVGKTLSLATAALLTALMDDGPALILAPSTLTQQWQVEMWDKLGVPSARWLSARKMWIDHLGHLVRTNGAADIVRCPYRIAIVSTGLIMHGRNEDGEGWRGEAEALLDKRASSGESSYGIVVLDEGHRARGVEERGVEERAPNNLMAFMLAMGHKARHVLVGTATPIQTDIMDLWDLMRVIASDAPHVLGSTWAPWRADPRAALNIVSGKERPRTEADAWPWISNPMPWKTEASLFDSIRTELQMDAKRFTTDASYTALEEATRQDLAEALATDQGELSLVQRFNPVVRHVVLRRRKSLEAAGLMKPVAVEIHPRANEPDYRSRALFDADGWAVPTTPTLQDAFLEADVFVEAMMARNKGAGLIRSLLLQRICSSVRSGLATARMLSASTQADLEDGYEGMDDEDEQDGELDSIVLSGVSKRETKSLIRLEMLLERAVAESEDPKYEVLWHYLTQRRWLDLGCIVFSQYFDTAEWIAQRLAANMPEEAIALYAGSGRSKVYHQGRRNAVERDVIKAAVRDRAVRLVIATDAACEGLNLQTLGTLINVDLPWNPSRLEQRIGRIKRFGQARDSVDMLNLVYQGSRDEAVYKKLSERMKDKFDIFGQLPDTLSDDWIDAENGLELELRKFVKERERANAFDVKWGNTANGVAMKADERVWQAGWRTCHAVLSRRDIADRLGRGW